MVNCMLKKYVKKQDWRYFVEGMSIFYSFRDKTQIQLDKFIKKLVKELDSYRGSSKRNDLKNAIKKNFKFKKILYRIIQKVDFISAFLIKLPLFVIQMRRMRKSHRKSVEQVSVIIAIASNRLQGRNVSTDLRQYLSFLVRDFSPTVQGLNVNREIELAPSLFICDPLLKSPLWEKCYKCWDAGIFILDSQFLLFQAMVSVLTLNFSTLLQGILKRKSLGNIKRSLAMSFFVESYNASFQGCNQIKALFLTSNSFSTEILRLYLIQLPNCVSVCEIMHGVPTVFYERYLDGILAAGEKYGHQAYSKHSSVSQIPMLPMFGILKQDVKCGIENAINPYLNRYIVENKLDKISVVDFVTGEYNRIFEKQQLSDDTLVITFIGAMSLDADYFSSDVFKVECFIIRQMIRILSNDRKSFIILYAPHPGHQFDLFKKCSFFQENNIILYQDTIFTWFISDASIALFSGALFEAAYFGVHSFMPTINCDELYPTVLLNSLCYPKDENSHCFVKALEQFFLVVSQQQPVDRILRAKNRINLFNDNIKINTNGDRVNATSKV